MNNFEFAITFILTAEGGFSDDPNDPGNWTSGKIGDGTLRGTKYGISAASYPNLDIKSLTPEQASQIYRHDFYERYHFDSINSPIITTLIMDAAILQGPFNAITIAQSLVNVTTDGIVGPLTLRALNTCDTILFSRRFTAKRITSLPAVPRYRDGWTERIIWCLTYSLTQTTT